MNEIHRMQQLAGITPLNEVTIQPALSNYLSLNNIILIKLKY